MTRSTPRTVMTSLPFVRRIGVCRFAAVLLASGFAATICPVASTAQTTPTQANQAEGKGSSGAREAGDPLASAASEIERLEKAVERTRNRDGELARWRAEVEQLAGRIDAIAGAARPGQALLAAQLRSLGPAPKAEAPAEADVVAERRAALNGKARLLDGRVRAAEVLALRARQLVTRIQALRRNAFRERIYKRSTPPLSPSVWRQFFSEMGPAIKQFGGLVTSWLRSVPSVLAILVFLGLLAGGYFALFKLARHFVARHRSRGFPVQVDFHGRATSALMVTLIRSVPPVALGGAVYLGLVHLTRLPESFANLAWSALQAFTIFAVVKALARTLLAPQRSEWRMMPVGDRTAHQLKWLIVGIAGVFAADHVLLAINRALFAPEAMTVVLNTVSSVALAGLLCGLVGVPFSSAAQSDAGEPAPVLWPIWLKGPLLLIAGAIIAASLLGFGGLARFLSSQVVVTGSVAVSVLLLIFAIREYSREVTAGRAIPDRVLPGNLALGEGARRRSSVLLGGFLSAAVVLGGAILVLLQWGFDWGDLVVWFRAGFFGFEIGGLRISVAAILVGIALFAAGLFLTRLFQRTLRQSILSPERIDAGLAHSINAVIGYAGVALAALMAVSYAGFDYTNLAIVAGALSVGIGFGLQSIVNNFVSGLILLAERPIQVGDWIEVGNKQGYVRQIKVRSTVIETFDRASLIIPNSDLMTGAVTNWTHGNKIGRVIVRVGVAYDSDPEVVAKILREAGEGHPLAQKLPPPSVVFEDFGASTLDFSLRLYIPDVNYILSVKSDLRLEILKTFRAAGIEIAFPQMDVHLKGGAGK